MRRVGSSWKAIEAVLQEHANSSYKALRPPASMASIGKLQKTVSVKLPLALVTSLQIHDGMRNAITLFGYITLLSAVEIAKWWRGEMDNPWDEPGSRLINGRRTKGDLRWRQKWIPIANDDGGNLVAVDLDPGPAGSMGQVFMWRNYGDPPPQVIAPSYAAWLSAVADEMASRRFTLDEFGSIQLRKKLA